MFQPEQLFIKSLTRHSYNYILKLSISMEVYEKYTEREVSEIDHVKTKKDKYPLAFKPLIRGGKNRS